MHCTETRIYHQRRQTNEGPGRARFTVHLLEFYGCLSWKLINNQASAPQKLELSWYGPLHVEAHPSVPFEGSSSLLPPSADELISGQGTTVKTSEPQRPDPARGAKIRLSWLFLRTITNHCVKNQSHDSSNTDTIPLPWASSVHGP